MNKKTFMIIVIMLVIVAVVIGGYVFLNQKKETEISEIQPEEEISDEQMRRTIVTLYYQNEETKELMPEGRMIDAKLLLTEPYQTLVELLMEKPKNEKLKSIIPEGTRVIKAERKGDIVYLDLSKEFIDNHQGGEELENKTIYSIVNTLTELNEINGVKILINGKEEQKFKDEKVTFKNAFMRIEKADNNKES